MPFFLGMDTGATKTHALISDEHGAVLGFGTSGTGNHEVVGYEGVRRALSEAFDQASREAGIPAGGIQAAGFGIAGYDFPSEKAETLDAIGVLGLNCPIELVNDVALGIGAGTTHGWGISVDAGSGNNVRGRDQHGREGWVTGCGAPFGEFGGSAEIVWRAVQAISHHWSRRGEPTTLSAVFCRELKAPDLTSLISGLAMGEIHPPAALTKQVFREAVAGDAVAREVVRWSAHELGQTVVAVAKQLDLTEQAFEVVQIGSVFRNGAIFTEPLHQSVHSAAPLATFVNLEAPPVTGAVVLAMQALGLDPAPVRPRLIAGAALRNN